MFFFLKKGIFEKLEVHLTTGDESNESSSLTAFMCEFTSALMCFLYLLGFRTVGENEWISPHPVLTHPALSYGKF